MGRFRDFEHYGIPWEAFQQFLRAYEVWPREYYSLFILTITAGLVLEDLRRRQNFNGTLRKWL